MLVSVDGAHSEPQVLPAMQKPILERAAGGEVTHNTQKGK
jgi:hypothetical protein